MWRKSRSSHLKLSARSSGVGSSRRDTWVEELFCCSSGLATMSGEVSVRYLSLLSPFDRTQGLVCGGKVGLVTLKYQLDPVAWVLPGKINAMKNSFRSSRGLATTSGKVNVRFISLLCRFDRAQGSVCGGKAGLVT